MRFQLENALSAARHAEMWSTYHAVLASKKLQLHAQVQKNVGGSHQNSIASNYNCGQIPTLASWQVNVCYKGHFARSQMCILIQINPWYKATPLYRPKFHSPMVATIEGFHCIYMCIWSWQLLPGSAPTMLKHSPMTYVMDRRVQVLCMNFLQSR